ncbi:MAG: undecaprenyldiphospho-muramoylpentapeptide beta-N-acetylglucosaminyltransferase [Bacteroidota bacterium]
MGRSRKRTTVVIAAGGTGGHLFPALSVADEVRRIHSEVRIVFVGSRGKIESRVVPERGYEFRTIWISGLRRRMSADLLVFPAKVLVSWIRSLGLLMQLKPAVVFGSGGYVSGPVVAAAAFLGIPRVIHEQNSVPGLTTKLLSFIATEIHTTFEETQKYLPKKKKLVVSGTPTRRELDNVSRVEGSAAFGIDPERPTLLIVGGSLGARTINDAVLGILQELSARSIQILWQTGEYDFGRVRAAAEMYSNVVVQPFFDRIEFAYAACDLVLCRAGASTIAELTRIGKPSILVPYPYATADHQTQNACLLAEKGAAVMIPDRELCTKLSEVLVPLLADRVKRDRMGEQARLLGKPDAAHVLAIALLRYADK